MTRPRSFLRFGGMLDAANSGGSRSARSSRAFLNIGSFTPIHGCKYSPKLHFKAL